ncbi:hypothetical protein [Longispora albida]|uniref:hypothetical protein n=1 Tax=Longispora albida TaxID=203523 RepID=UPI00037184DE|nr:hypothetical protein [Longispora albida]
MSTDVTRDDNYWMSIAIEEAALCPPDEKAYSVGAVIVGADGKEISRGHSREWGRMHAEEAALAKLDPEMHFESPDIAESLKTATIYSTLEPCTERASGRAGSCTHLILTAGIPRVVIAWTEPDLFVANCVGVETLRAGGVEVIELPEFEEKARAANAHLNV